jgi:hypothetical protein
MKSKFTKLVNNNGLKTIGEQSENNALCHLTYMQEQELLDHTKYQLQQKPVLSSPEMEYYTTKGMEALTNRRNIHWKGTKQHRLNKSRYYETWYKAIRIENAKYQKAYYLKREREIWDTELSFLG